MRNLDLVENLKNTDAIIHLACISNDPSFELNPNLGKSINYDCFEPIVKCAKINNVKGLFMLRLQVFMVLKKFQMYLKMNN